jgi:glucose/arabinose dehydrogenase
MEAPTTMRMPFLAALALLLSPLLASAQVARPAIPGMVQGNRGPTPAPVLKEGQTIETLSPELPTDAPLFPEQTRAPYRASAPFKVATITDQLHAPWAIAFLPSGNYLVTERLPGALRIIGPDGKMPPPVAGMGAASASAVFGLLDVVLDRDYRRNHRIFFTFFETRPRQPGPGITNGNTYVARATLDEASNSVRDVTVIFRTVPAWPSERLGAKTGGRIAIGRDGNLLVVIGDRDDNPQQTIPDWMAAQKLDNDLGKIIRITPDGAPAPGNPFLNTPGARPEIWSIGHRSPQGLVFAPDGKLWEAELGPRGGDEINLIEKGKNYGWPLITHGIDYPGTMINNGLTHQPGMEQPVYYWSPSRNPSGIAWYNASLFPQWHGSLFVAMLNGKFLDRLSLRNGKVVAEEPMLLEQNMRIRHVAVGPDGAVYVLTDTGGASMADDTPIGSKLLRLTPG